MNQDVKNKWVNELRYGEISHSVYDSETDTWLHCPTGVLYDIVQAKDVITLKKLCDMPNGFQKIKYMDKYYILKQLDDLGLSFKEVADLIESQY